MRRSTYPEPSTLPYLQDEPQPPLPPPPPSVQQPPLRPSAFPRFIPPPVPTMTQALSASTTPQSLYPPAVDYHVQALAIVGAHPGLTPRQEKPEFYPAMMRPQNSVPGRASMPVEAVMARYGQALPNEPRGSPPILFRSESAPTPSQMEVTRRRLSRPQPGRRAQSDQQQPSPQYLAPPPPQQLPSPESPGEPSHVSNAVTKPNAILFFHQLEGRRDRIQLSES